MERKAPEYMESHDLRKKKKKKKETGQPGDILSTDKWPRKLKRHQEMLSIQQFHGSSSVSYSQSCMMFVVFQFWFFYFQDLTFTVYY